MHARILRRAATLGVLGSLMAAGFVTADSVRADADSLTPGAQGSVDLGVVAPGASVVVPVSFTLTCGGTSHLDPGQVVTLSPFGTNAPAGGGLTATGTTVSPPAGWPGDGSPCADPAQTSSSATPATIVLTAPSAIGGPYPFDVLFKVTSAGHLAGIATYVGVAFVLSVGVNTAPTLALPGDLAVVTDDPAGAVVAFAATATDAEDGIDPAVACAPASGSWFPVGTTTVTCSATDLGGLTATGGFDVAVRYETPVTVWFETPVRASGPTPAPTGRTLPVKVHIVDGDGAVMDGDVDLVLAACDGSWRGAPPIPMTPTGPRWMANVGLGGMAGCVRVAVRLDGRVVGGFDIASALPSDARHGGPLR